MECVFCRIVAGQSPARLVYQDEEVIAFHDIHPAAPLHLLIVPKKHIASLNEVDAEDVSLLAHLLLTAKELAEQAGVKNGGYRLVINVGRGGGQTVFHLHVHLLGGRPFLAQVG